MDELDIEQYRRQKPSSEDDISQYARKPTTGFPGVYSDLKDIVQNLKPSLNAAVAAAPHAIEQFGEQALSLPYENLKFIGKTALHGYNPENVPKASANLFKGLISGLNLPSELVDYAGEKGFIPKNLGHYIRAEMPETGLKPEEENPITQSIPFLGRTAVDAFESIHPTMHLNNARNIGRQRQIGNLPIPEHLLTEAEQFLPTNLATQNLLEAARAGGYDNLFTLQSDLGRAGRQLTRSFSGAERLHGRQANQLRQQMLNSIRQGLIDAGHGDIAELMRRGQRNYRRYQRVIKPLAAGSATLAIGANPLQKLISQFMEQ